MTGSDGVLAADFDKRNGRAPCAELAHPPSRSPKCWTTKGMQTFTARCAAGKAPVACGSGCEIGLPRHAGDVAPLLRTHAHINTRIHARTRRNGANNRGKGAGGGLTGPNRRRVPAGYRYEGTDRKADCGLCSLLV